MIEKTLGESNPLSDALETHPEFQDSMEEMNDEFFKKNDPEFYAVMKKAGGALPEENGTREGSG